MPESWSHEASVLSFVDMVSYRWRGPALAALLVAEAMNLLDTTIVQVASPAIRADLAGGEGEMQWLTAAYTLPFALLLITGGRLGDIFGRRRTFVTGMVVLGVLRDRVGHPLAARGASRAGRRRRLDHSADVRPDPRHVRGK